VVFRYTSVNIPAGVTVTFTNHPSRAPVVWLVSGNVTISGTAALDGANGHPIGGPFSQAEPGPGGYRGGRGASSGAPSANSGGFGPGGARSSGTLCSAAGGSYGTSGTDNGSSQTGPAVGPQYGNANLLPLQGGSGGTTYPVVSNCAGSATPGAGAGGGAILIAAAQSITLSSTGRIHANGGNDATYPTNGWGAGSGGAIRLVADTVTGQGLLQAVGGGLAYTYNRGGSGRIRVEANTVSLTDGGTPAFTSGLPGSIATIWPPAAAPTITATLIGGQAVPSAPLSSLNFPNADVALTNPNPVVVQLQCTNVPTNSTVNVRVVPKSGRDLSVPATFVNGDINSSIWQTAASGPNAISLPDGFSAIQARAVLP